MNTGNEKLGNVDSWAAVVKQTDDNFPLPLLTTGKNRFTWIRGMKNWEMWTHEPRWLNKLMTISHLITSKYNENSLNLVRVACELGSTRLELEVKSVKSQKTTWRHPGGVLDPYLGIGQWWLDTVRKAWWGYRSIRAQLRWTFVLCGSRRAKKIQLQELELTKMEVSPFLVVQLSFVDIWIFYVTF